MNWISIFKELPEPHTDILFYSRKNGIFLGQYIGHKPRKSIWATIPDKIYWTQNEDLDFNNPKDDFITHWCALPNEPTKGVYEVD